MMKKLWVVILFILVNSLLFGQNNNNSILKFNGIYATTCDTSIDKDGEQSFLRFYPNQVVISVGTDCDTFATTIEDLKVWFNLEHKNVSIGNFKYKNNKLSFFTTSISGTVKYKGRITENGVLKLKIKSLINGYSGKEDYQFVKILDLK